MSKHQGREADAPQKSGAEVNNPPNPPPDEEQGRKSPKRYLAIIPYVDLADGSGRCWFGMIEAASRHEAYARLSTLENGDEGTFLDTLLGSRIHEDYKGPSYLEDYGLSVSESFILDPEGLPSEQFEIDPEFPAEPEALHVPMTLEETFKWLVSEVWPKAPETPLPPAEEGEK